MLDESGRYRVDADLDRAGAADDAGARLLLRRAGALEERAQHDDDELHLARLRRRRCGRSSATRWRSRPATTGSATSRASFLRGVGLEAAAARSRTCSSCATRARSASSPRRSSPAPSSSACASPPTSTFITLWALVVYAPVAHWVWGGGWLVEDGRARLRRRHRRARQRRRRGAGGRDRRRQAARLSSRRRCCRTTCRSRCSAPGLLWFGWFGFNAGSALAANGIAALAFTTTMLAPAGTLVVWTLLDVARTRQADRRRRRDRRSSSAWSPSRRRPASSAR